MSEKREWWPELYWLRDHLASLPDDHPLHAHIANLHNEVEILRVIVNNGYVSTLYFEATRDIARAWRDKYEHETIFPTRFWAAVVNESEDENA